MAELVSEGSAPVAALVADNVTFVAPDASLREAAELLAAADIGALVVGDGRSVLGVLSERDIVRAVASGRDPDRTNVAELANATILWCDVTATVAEVAGRMMEHYVRHILVEEDGALAGIVSARDLLGAYAALDSSFGDGW